MSRRVQVPAERLQRWLDGFSERHGEPSLAADAATLRLVGADGDTAVLTTPFPPWATDEDPACDPVTAFVAHVTRDRLVGVVLVRRGGHAVGVFDGPRLLASKVDSSYVQGTTKAGGWSQQRFARRRANQAAAAFGAAADHAARVLTPYRGRLQHLVTGGDRAAIEAVLDDQRLAWAAALRTGDLLAVPDPRLKVLQATPERFRGVRIDLDP